MARRRIAVVALCMSGCFVSGHHHNTAYHLNGLAAVIGTFLVVKAPSTYSCMGLDNTPPPGDNGDLWTPYRACRNNDQSHNLMLGIGGGLVAAALVGTIINYAFMHPVAKDDTLHPNDEGQIQAEVDLLDIGTKDERLISLTKEAAFAARKENCRVVRLIYQRVRVLDVQFSDTGFVKDNTIERCVRQLDTQ